MCQYCKRWHGSGEGCGALIELAKDVARTATARERRHEARVYRAIFHSPPLWRWDGKAWVRRTREERWPRAS